MQYHFQVVNHQIENNTDICAAIGIGRKAMCLNETRMRQSRLECAQDGIEALDVPNLQNQIFGGR